jgi:EmrB/QacA subfamily drug resistance transporter
MVILEAVKPVRRLRGDKGRALVAPALNSPALISPALISITLICSAQLMIVIDGTIVNVAIPSITQHLGLSAAGPAWIVNAYTLAFGGCLMLGGRAADLLGRLPVFCAGIALFTAGSVACGLAGGEVQLIAGRAVQGLGAALASPAALAVMTASYAEGPERNRAFAVWGAISGGAGAVGMIVGGVLTQSLSWRWIFFVNVPVGIAVLCLAGRFIPRGRDYVPVQRVDVAGCVAITSSLVLIVLGLVNGGDWGWGSARTAAALGGGAALLALFAVIEARSTQPLIDLALLRRRVIVMANVLMFFLMSGLFAAFFFLSQYFQNVRHASPIVTGLAFLAMALPFAVSSQLTPRLQDRWGGKPTLLAALGVAAVGVVFLAAIGPGTSYWAVILPGLVLYGSGLGGAIPVVTIASQSGVSEHAAGVAGGLITTVQQVGGAIGLAALSALCTAVTQGRLASTPPAAAGPGSPAHVAALLAGYHWVFLADVPLTAAALLLSVVALRPQELRVAEGAVHLPVA